MLFDDVIGHKAQINYLRRVLTQAKQAHAYTFVGPAGTGKKTIAERFVEQLLGLTPGALGNNPDVTVIRREEDEKGGRKKTISIEVIKEACARLGLSAVGSLKVVIIEEADLMTPQAQNALLKTLEEPQGPSLVILLAEDRQRLLPTLLSRVVSLHFSYVSPEDITRGLLRLGYSPQIAEEAACLSAGRPGIALSYADADRLMTARRERSKLEAFIDAPLFERFKTISEITKGDDALSGDARTVWLEALSTILHDRLRTNSRMVPALDALLSAREAIRDNVSPTLAIERIALAL